MEIRSAQLATIGFYQRSVLNIQKSQERILTARVINRGADNPVNLQFAKGMQAQERGFLAAMQNTQDGISMIQTTDSKLDAIQDILFRIRDLAVRASNEAIHTCAQKDILHEEARTLVAEINRIALTATFNTKRVLTGDEVADIKATAGTQQVVSSGATASAPSWSATDKVVFTEEAAVSAARPSSNAGDTTFRAFEQTIDTATNATVGAPTQLTGDPSLLTDADADGFYDQGAGGLNDPDVGDPLYPLNDVDADGDGYRATVDDDDASAVETGTGLNALNFDIVHATAAAGTSKNFTPVTNAGEYALTGGLAPIDRMTVNVTNGQQYFMEYSADGGTTWNDAGAGIQTGTGANQTFDFAQVNADSVRVRMNDVLTNAATNASMVSVQDKTAAARPAGAPVYTGVPTTRYAEYTLTGGPVNVDEITLTVTAGKNYDVQYWTGVTWQNTSATAQVGTGGAQTLSFTEVNTTQIRVALDPLEDASAEVSAVSFADNGVSTLATNAPTYVADPIPPDNVADFTLGASQRVDRITVNVTAGLNYTVRHSNDGGTTYTTLGSGVGTGANANLDVTGAELDVDTVQIYLDSYEDVSADANLVSVENRIDRDSDGFPDVIEGANGSNRDNAGSVPFGATGGPDDDNDGFLDAPLLYDTREADFLASSNPFGFGWANGTGNPLNAAAGQYPLVGDTVSAAQVPSNTDTDGDTLPDPLDPFPNDAEWTTWVDGSAAYKGGSVAFISNRATPDPSAAPTQDLYLYDGTTYTRLTNTGDADNPVYSEDGTALAWEQGGDIWGSFIQESCAGVSAVTQMIAANGTNPTWSPDNTQVAFERGGQIILVDVASGAETDPNIAGSNPNWGPDGDHIVYTRGGQIYAYNLLLQREFDLALAGDNPTWSPDGTKLAYVSGTDVMVTDVTITRNPQVLHVDANGQNPDEVTFSLPDARTFNLGLTTLKLFRQPAATAAIDSANTAIGQVSEFRAQLGEQANKLRFVMDFLSVKRIEMAAANSNVWDANLAAESGDLARANLMRATTQSMLRQTMNQEAELTLGAIRRNVDLLAL